MKILAAILSTALSMMAVFAHASTAAAQTTGLQTKHKQAKVRTQPAPPTTHKCRGNAFHQNRACY